MLALKALRGRGLRVPVAVLGVAASCVLVLVLRGAGLGVNRSIERYAGQPSVDLWVMPKGTESLLRATALLPAETDATVQDIDGVADAAPLARGFARVERGDTHIAMLGVGYEVDSGMGGPPAWVEGRAPESSDEVGLDRVAAWRLGVGVGDEVLVNDAPTTVVGLSDGTNLLASQFAFQTPEATGAGNGTIGRPAYLLVSLEPGADAARVADSIERALPGTVAWTREDFVANNQREAAEGFAPLFQLSFGLGAVSSALLVALIVHGLVEDRRADMAVLLALGASLARVGGTVLAHGAAIVATGCALGTLGAVGLAFGLDRWAPILPIAFTVADVARVVGAFALASVVATAASVLRLRHVDPMEAFRS